MMAHYANEPAHQNQLAAMLARAPVGPRQPWMRFKPHGDFDILMETAFQLVEVVPAQTYWCTLCGQEARPKNPPAGHVVNPALPVAMKKAEFMEMTEETKEAHGRGRGKASDKHRQRYAEAVQRGELVDGEEVIMPNDRYIVGRVRCNICCLTREGHTRYAHSELKLLEVMAHFGTAKHISRLHENRGAIYCAVHGANPGVPHRRMGMDAW
jgi:hypothetical protein